MESVHELSFDGERRAPIRLRADVRGTGDAPPPSQAMRSMLRGLGSRSARHLRDFGHFGTVVECGGTGGRLPACCRPSTRDAYVFCLHLSAEHQAAPHVAALVAADLLIGREVVLVPKEEAGMMNYEVWVQPGLPIAL